ncbi:glycosyltransferase [Micromonospora sp. HNM0581]|uniref:glycosyltransferase n=2 Tax=Bacteria TaxID=2 RepID=UPI00146B5916|nr:glycosyltransferase [Micromonospora sp. HNM0581]
MRPSGRVPSARSPEPNPYRVLATCDVFEPGYRGGGPVRSLAAIVDTLPDGVELTLVTGDRDLGSVTPYPGLSSRWVRRNERATVFYLSTRSLRSWSTLSRKLRKTTFDLLYVNSLWSPFSVFPIVASALGLVSARQVLIAPRGELSPGALRLKGGKKKIFLRVWRPMLRRLQVRWQACSDLERKHILDAFPAAEVLLGSNGASLPSMPMRATDRDAPETRLRLVFISRISPMKNLLLALTAVRQVTEAVSLDIYGPIEDRQYWARCQSMINTMPANVEVGYRGELAPDQVRPTFNGYDASLLPTLGENFGHVILESLAASCPVICSDRTPWSDLIEAGGGVVIRSLTERELATRIGQLARTSSEARLRARLRAGEAYLAWRRATPDVHVLTLARDSRRGT